MIRGIFNALTDKQVRRNWRWLALLRAGRLFLPRYRFQYPQMAWWDDPAFNAYLEKFGLMGSMNSDRRWVLHQLTKLAASVPGDTAECGVFNGSSSYLICQALDRPHFMFDSFEGLSQPSYADSEFAAKNSLACSLETAQHNLAGFPKAVFYKGWIPERFPEVRDHRFCFVHIDVQLAQPTRDSLEFFYPRLNPGGLIVFDDYGFTTCPGARQAIDKFMSDKPERIIELSGGSAFLIHR